MAQITKANVVKEVRVILDENKVSPSLDGVGELDTLSTDEVIESCIDKALRIVMMHADTELFDSGTTLERNKYKPAKQQDNGVIYGIVELPDDYIRMLSAKLYGWDYALGYAHPRGSDMYYVQHGHSKSLLATHDRPVAVVTPDGKHVELFPVHSMSEESLEHFIYLSSPSTAEGYVISDKLYPGVIYVCASLVATSFGDMTSATAFENIARQYYKAITNVSDKTD